MKAAFFDIDGTLTSEKTGKVPDSVYESVRLARANGNRMYLCSGRCLCHIGKPFQDLHMDGMICGCGTQVILAEAGEIFHRVLNEREVEILHDIGKQAGFDVLYESSDKIGFDPNSLLQTTRSRRLADILQKDFGNIIADPEKSGFSCDKVCLFTGGSEKAGHAMNAVSSFMTIIDRGDGLYELVPKGISKATGIRTVLNYEHFTVQEAYGFGDSNNDEEMLRYVGHAIVMGNAYPEKLKELAEYVAPKASENGISVALTHLGFVSGECIH